MLPAHDAASQERSPIQFAITAQPLATALDTFSIASGLELYYDGALAVGRRSSAVEGRLAPEVALQELLAGSGLVARATGPNSFTIKPAPRLTSARHQTYFAAIQGRVSQVLCARAETRPGDVDLLLQLWVASTGAIQRVQLLDPPNAGKEEAAFATALRGISIGIVPPAELPQPVVMAVLARSKGERAGCVDVAATAVR
ncbi:STN domain-containing protein [Bradyrhizobium sp. WSM 1738]|uniref:STN domain-containing protein n=1 Tax=Bradyrhizobium hereditatis TaxID=2821405 RepID=UPI001CE286C6|nr:STN domain-containing protein [Bradyrhizobium hereditatis]MCA6116447.1 STN domain-containing protein [Bradyrhizobium hereditatis]